MTLQWHAFAFGKNMSNMAINQCGLGNDCNSKSLHLPYQPGQYFTKWESKSLGPNLVVCYVFKYKICTHVIVLLLKEEYQALNIIILRREKTLFMIQCTKWGKWKSPLRPGRNCFLLIPPWTYRLKCLFVEWYQSKEGQKEWWKFGRPFFWME